MVLRGHVFDWSALQSLRPSIAGIASAEREISGVLRPANSFGTTFSLLIQHKQWPAFASFPVA